MSLIIQSGPNILIRLARATATQKQTPRVASLRGLLVHCGVSASLRRIIHLATAMIVTTARMSVKKNRADGNVVNGVECSPAGVAAGAALCSRRFLISSWLPA